MDTLTNLSVALGHALLQRSYKLALAESCTGGLASATITDIAGSSAWFDRGFITYSNASKLDMLNVDAKTLAEHGAVSEETAVEMALGALQHSDANISGSITGIAGPSGGSTNKPVGTVCFSWAVKNGRVVTSTMHFTGNRQEIRHQAVIQLITGLIEILAQQD
jgi:nicotinamide-nucleotide amidase